jgi:hypothetical protein
MREGGGSPVNDSPDTPRFERTASNSDPQVTPGSRSGQVGSAVLKISLNRSASRRSQRDGALSAALTEDPDGILFADVSNLQRREFTDAHAGGVENLEQGPIPQLGRLCTIEFIQEIPDGPLRQRMRKRLRSTRSSDVIRRVEDDFAPASLVGKEDLHRRGFAGNRTPRVPKRVEVRDESPDQFAIHIRYGVRPGSISKGEELTEVAAIGGQRVRREVPLGGLPNQEVFHRRFRPGRKRREWSHPLILPGRSPPVNVLRLSDPAEIGGRGNHSTRSNHDAVGLQPGDSHQDFRNGKGEVLRQPVDRTPGPTQRADQVVHPPGRVLRAFRGPEDQ